MNKLIIVGNVTRDPESRTTPSGKQVCTFSVAVNRNGKEADKADFFRCTVWDKLAESCGKYIIKGMKVGVVGRVGLNLYKGNDGETTGQLEVDRIDEVEFLSRADKEEELPFK